METAEASARVSAWALAMRDGRQDADDRHDDHQLDQREAALITELAALLGPPLNHWGASLSHVT